MHIKYYKINLKDTKKVNQELENLLTINIDDLKRNV